MVEGWPAPDGWSSLPTPAASPPGYITRRAAVWLCCGTAVLSACLAYFAYFATGGKLPPLPSIDSGANPTANLPPETSEAAVRESSEAAVRNHVNMLNQWSDTLERNPPIAEQWEAEKRAAAAEEKVRQLGIDASHAEGIDKAIRKYAKQIRMAKERLATAKAKAGSSGP